MKRVNWKLTFYVTLICLPAVVALVVVTSSAVNDIAKVKREERERVSGVFREAAEGLLDEVKTNRVAGTRIPYDQRGKDWRPLGGERKKGVGGKSVAAEWKWRWGKGGTNGIDIVWVRLGTARYINYVPAPPVKPVDLTMCWLIAFGSLFVDLVLIGLAVFAVWYFVRFMKERDDFLAATAHDLTTPLVGLRLVIGRNDAEAKNLNERMIRLVQNLKDFLKLGGRPKPKAETFDLISAYREAYALFAADYRDLFDDEDVAVDCSRLLSTAVDGTLTVPVFADETLTVQILWNLLGNDLKYAAPYGRVSVRFAREGRFVSCEFVDEGQGMAPNEMRKAFDRYYRAKTVLETGKGGFGIGLCTAKEFAQAMGGDLTVRANAPKGCIFTLTLPSGS